MTWLSAVTCAFRMCISGTNFTPTKSESEPVGAAANGAKRGETYNSLRAITISVYRVVLRAWHEKRFFRNAVRPPLVCGRVNRQTYERGVRQRGVRADDSASAGPEILQVKKKQNANRNVSSPQTSKEDKPALVLNWASRRIWQDNSEVRALRMVFLRNALL